MFHATSCHLMPFHVSLLPCERLCFALLSCAALSLQLEHLRQRVVQDAYVVVDQHALVGCAALSHDADEGEVARNASLSAKFQVKGRRTEELTH